MQYANIIIDHRAGFEPLTYAIPPELLAHISVGSVVLAPFGNQTVHGVVDKFIRNVKSDLSAKLKPIKSVVYPGAVVEPERIEAVHWLREKYGVSMGQTLFRQLPEFPKRLQQPITSELHPGSKYQVSEYQISVKERADWYKKVFLRLKKHNGSLLIITANQITAQTLANKLGSKIPVMLFPETPTPKDKRDYWLNSQTHTSSQVFIGTRGVLITSFNTLGAVIIDEPWLPGHKDDMSPRFWSVFLADALCKYKKIPLLLVSSLRWPESKLFPIKTSQQQQTKLGNLILTPKRGLKEQITHWLSETENQANRAIIIHESPHETLWCDKCRKVVTNPEACPTCGSIPVLLPRLTQESITELISDTAITIRTSDNIQFETSPNSLLVLNFDSYLAITDFRASLYLGTLLRHLQEQSQCVYLATSHPDTWTNLEKSAIDSYDHELTTRQNHQLPPFSLLVRLQAPQRDILQKLLPLQLPDLIRIGKVHRNKEVFVLTLLFKPNASLPPEWAKQNLFKVDIMPLYLGA